MGEAIHQCQATTSARDRDRSAVTARADDGRGLFEDLGGLLDSGEAFDPGEQVFIESFRAACMELEVCRPGNRVYYACSRASEAARRDSDGEHECDSHSHAKSGE
jgi:hypothetical protein